MLPDLTKGLTYSINKGLHGPNITGNIKIQPFPYYKATKPNPPKPDPPVVKE